MAGQFEPLPGVGDLGAVDFQDGEILVEVIADKQIFSVGRECRSLRQTAQLNITYLGDFLAIDTQHRSAAVALVEIGAFVVGALQDHRHSHVALRRDGKSFGPIANYYTVGNAYRIELEVDHAHRIDAAGAPLRGCRATAPSAGRACYRSPCRR